MARKSQRELLTAAEHRARHRPGLPSKIADEEVRAFINQRLHELTFSQLAEAALERFGKDRAPSRSVIHRHWQALSDRKRR